MLDKWEDDVLGCLIEINKEQGRKGLFPDDEIASTNAVFSLIKSYAFRDEFPGVFLEIANSSIPYAKIYLPAVNDPFSDNLDIRDIVTLHPLKWKYEYPEYWDDEDGPEPEVWERPSEPTYTKHFEPLAHEKTEKVLALLRQKSPYYARLLETDPENQIKNLKALDDIDYEFSKNCGYHELDNMTSMGKYSGGNIREVFGHRYVGADDNRHHVVAKNWLGPVGLLCLFDHAKKKISDKDPSRYSIAYVSISPSYRRQGIGTNLMREAFRAAIADERYLCRTGPSVMGRETIYDHFTKLAKKEFPHIPFVKREEARYLHAFTKHESFQNWPYSSKCKAINDLANKIDEMATKIRVERGQFFGHEHVDLDELQTFADELWNKYSPKPEKERSIGLGQSI